MKNSLILFLVVFATSTITSFIIGVVLTILADRKTYYYLINYYFKQLRKWAQIQEQIH